MTLIGEGSYSSAEVQSVYSTTPADWAKQSVDDNIYTYVYIIQVFIFRWYVL